MVKANRFETRPLYLQVRDMLLGRITTGTWKPGTLIPNEIDLAREFGLSVGTVRKALDQLQAEHLVTRRQGRGTFVNDLGSAEYSSRFASLYGADGKPLELTSRLLSVEIRKASDAERNLLEIAKGANVIHLVRLRSNATRPCMLETSILAEGLFSGLNSDEDIPDEITGLAQKYGQIAGSAEETVTLVNAEPDVAAQLAIDPGSPLLMLERRTFAVDGVVIEWRRALCHMSHGHYRSQLG